MFTVALDTRNVWYRYHHIFRELLRDELARQASAPEIAALHLRASGWFAQQGLLEPALHHALQGNDVPAAVRLLAEQRHALMDAEQWQLLERTLRMFPAQTITHYPDLLLIKAWLTELNRSDPQYVKDIVDRAAALIAHAENQTVNGTHLAGEIDTLRAMAGYMAAKDPAQVVTLAQQALASTPRTRYFVRAVAWLRLALTYQMLGRLDQAYAALAEGAPEDVSPDGAVRARVAGSRCFVEWMAGDLPAIAQGATHVVAVGKTHQRLETLGWGHYFLAGAAYQRNDLATAEKHAQAGEEIRYTGRPMTYLQSAFIYASICQARGQPDQAQQKLDLAFEFLNETGSEGLVPLAQAFQAELALRQGDPGAARHWATTAGPFLPFTALPYHYAPQLTLPKFLLALDTSGSRRQAAEVLSRLHGFVTSIHNTPFTIEVLALQALLHDAQGDRPAALALLQQAVALAEPGGFIRLFVDLGPRLASLLAQLCRAGAAAGYADQILPAFHEPAATVPHTAVPVDRHMELIEPLTNRELEVLVLLAQRLSNKEIARVLVISTQTVKRHAANIYQKLQVNGRRAAVVEATRLGLL
jgi:LuxR family maltose regulon positive regulatory protein